MKFIKIDFNKMGVHEIYEALQKKEAEAEKIEALDKRLKAIPEAINKALDESPTIHGMFQVYREFFNEMKEIHLEVTGKEPDYEEDLKWIASMERKFALKN